MRKVNRFHRSLSLSVLNFNPFPIPSDLLSIGKKWQRKKRKREKEEKRKRAKQVLVQVKAIFEPDFIIRPERARGGVSSGVRSSQHQTTARLRLGGPGGVVSKLVSW